MDKLEITPEMIREIAALERRMDAGEQPFVKLGDERMAVMQEVMEELGLESGQTVPRFLFNKILEASIGVCKSQIAMKELTKGPET